MNFGEAHLSHSRERTHSKPQPAPCVSILLRAGTRPRLPRTPLSPCPEKALNSLPFPNPGLCLVRDVFCPVFAVFICLFVVSTFLSRYHHGLDLSRDAWVTFWLLSLTWFMSTSQHPEPAWPALPLPPPLRPDLAGRLVLQTEGGRMDPCQPPVYALGLGVSGAAASWSCENVLKKCNWGCGGEQTCTYHSSDFAQASRRRKICWPPTASCFCPWPGRDCHPLVHPHPGKTYPCSKPSCPSSKLALRRTPPLPLPATEERESSLPLHACLSQASPQLPYFCFSQITLDFAPRNAYLFLLKGWQSPTFCGSHGADPPSEGELRRLLPGWALALGGPHARPDAWKSVSPASLGTMRGRPCALIFHFKVL